MFGLTVRYLGIALGTSMALGYCATFGTLLPPIFSGEFGSVIHTTAGLVVMGGVGVCLLGIVISGLAGVAKEEEVREKDKQASTRQLRVVRGCRHTLVYAVLLLWNGNDQDGPIRFLELDAAHGNHHYLWHTGRYLSFRMEGGQPADLSADATGLGSAGFLHRGHRL